MAYKRYKGNLKPRQLTPRQKKFVEEYLNCGSSTKAYRAAGYATRKPKIVANLAWNVLNSQSVQHAIALRTEARQAAAAKQVEFTIERLREEFLAMYRVCNEERDRSNALRALEGLTRTVGGFTDVHRTDVNVKTEMTEIERRERKRIAAMLLDQEEENAGEEGVEPPKGAGACKSIVPQDLYSSFKTPLQE